jgi:uncharacterized damage-inducible protein DinB
VNAVIEKSNPETNGTAHAPTSPAAAALVVVLRQLGALLESLTDEQYTQKPVGVVPSSIGGHVRHCLDHVESLLASVDCGLIDYDRRTRGTDVEMCRPAAFAALRRVERPVIALGMLLPATLLWLSVLPSSTAPATEVRTSLGRELAFVLSHTIHHNALIAVMARLLGVPVPERFGYAPSTIAYLEQKSCAQ